MDYPTLLLQLENQLQFLQNKRHDYLNIEAMPKVELKQLLEGLGSMMHEKEPESQANPNAFRQHTSTVEIIDQQPNPPTLFPPSIDNPVFFEQKKNLKSLDQTIILAKNVAQKISLAENSLTELMCQYEKCQNCALEQTRTNIVFGSGLAEASIIFLGEGPGADEDAQGLPFVGIAGKLLTKMIHTIGIDRNDTYITNIVKCCPPGKRIPTPQEISCCLPILHRQIELVNPKLIVTLGNIPTRALIPDIQGITKSRGKVLSYGKWKVLPTFHPSYLLSNRSALPLAWEDFRKIPQLAFHS